MAPLLPVDTFFRLMGWNPWHAAQLAGSAVPVVSGCDDVIYQHAWQSADAMARTDIADAIENAEALLRQYLGFSVAPRWTSATVAYPTYLATGYTRAAQLGSDGHWLTVQLPEGHVAAIGTEALTLLGTVAVVTSDQDGDGVDETFTATLATTVTDPAALAVYFAAADRLYDTGQTYDYAIRPVTIAISAGVATVRGKRWLLVDPAAREGVTRRALNATANTSFVDTIAIYQRTTAASGQVTLSYDTQPWPWFCGCSTDGSSSDPAAIGTTIGRAGIVDGRHGIVSAVPASLNADTGIWTGDLAGCRQPDRVTIPYLAGLPLVGGQMDHEWAVTVARLAAAELARPICACQSANREVQRWQRDAARTNAGADELGAISADDLNNDLGTRLGHIYAHRRIKSLAQMRAFTL